MKHLSKVLILLASLLFLVTSSLLAKPSSCEDCHKKVTPGIVKDFNRGKMAKKLTCKSCHGSAHKSANDVAKAKLPTISTCKRCHKKQVKLYTSGKHYLGLVAITAFPGFAHKQPKAFIAGQKGCNGCHNLGIDNANVRKSELRKYYKYGMDCQNCHTRHAFSVKEAKEPEACNSCHTGFDHAQWEMWFHSKHGSAYVTDRKAHRGPTCQDCHMPNGNHKVMTAWGFLALRLPEKDKEWLGYRVEILKALGVLDAKTGKPTKVLDVVKAGKIARLTAEEWQAERNKMLNTCKKCHSENFAKENLKNADLMIKAADKLFAEAIDIVRDLYKDGILPKAKYQINWPYPNLLNFYEVNTPIEEKLYEIFMDYRMKTYQAAFHIMPDYTTWYGYAKIKETLVEMKEMAKQMRLNAKCEKNMGHKGNSMKNMMKKMMNK